MSQVIWSSINPASTSGTQLATILNNFKNAYVSGNSGTTRPTNLAAGGFWIDTTNEGSPTFYWSFKIFVGGSTDVEIFRINLATNAASISGADNSFTISEIANDTTGAILNLLKERAGGGAVDDGDVIGEVTFKGMDDASVQHIVGRLKVVATDDYTSSLLGAYMVFEATPDGSSTLTEMMRLVDSKLGIGITAPTKALHVRGITGIMAENQLDSAAGGIISVKKRRVTGNAPDSGDVIGQYDFRADDDASAEGIVAQLLATALQDHTSAAKGTSLTLKSTASGSATLTSRMTIGAVIESLMRHDFNALKFVSQDIATTASITAMDTSKPIAIFTGSTATAIKAMDATGASQVIHIHNRSTAVLTVNHEFTSGTTAANRFTLPESVDLDILPHQTASFFYSITESRWKLLSKTVPSSALRPTTVEAITGGGTISSSTTVARQLRTVVGTGGETTASTTPFGTGANWLNGTEIELVGTDDANPVVLTANDAANGIIGNFSTISLGYGIRQRLIYSAELSRWLI